MRDENSTASRRWWGLVQAATSASLYIELLTAADTVICQWVRRREAAAERFFLYVLAATVELRADTHPAAGRKGPAASRSSCSPPARTEASDEEVY